MELRGSAKRDRHKYDTDNGEHRSQPGVVGNTLYVLSDDGSLTAFRADAPDTLLAISRLEPARESISTAGRRST